MSEITQRKVLDAMKEHRFISSWMESKELLYASPNGQWDLSKYQGWTVGLVIPNGGYLGVDIAHPSYPYICSRYTELEPDHDYHDATRLIEMAHRAIDSVMPPTVQLEIISREKS